MIPSIGEWDVHFLICFCVTFITNKSLSIGLMLKNLNPSEDFDYGSISCLV